MDFWMVLHLLSLLNMARCSPVLSSYTVHLNKNSFTNAQSYCKPGSVLTDIPDKKEMDKILKTIWDKTNRTAVSFWVGLKKDKGACVQQGLPLKGFYWTVNNSTESEANMWKSEPSSTCTDVRCGLLSVEYGNSGVTNSGFMDATCKQQHPFICKRNMETVCQRPQIHDTKYIIDYPEDPYTCQVVCNSDANYTLTCSHDLVWTIVGKENIDVSELCLECKSGYRRDAFGNCVNVNECEESEPCKHGCKNTEGSYICDKLPTTLPKKKDEYSHNEEDKSVQPQPTVLSEDVRMNDRGVQIEESVGDISNIIVPVIIALLIFIVLVVIVAAIVKGCLRRRTIKRARRKAEAVGLNGSSSMEKVNEKEET
ncbi:C-type lectin domain family 14 member A [Danio aesculapii]|uniref:C-type lectin domain family 14 member A n=1 Tax=Danio aesculapii TaxID=1142201 RepID=UPI0024C02D86|nr:C-type lectin domain family 14 member A [Danio aesculapii]